MRIKGLNLQCFENKEIIFYTLILNEKENQKIQESPDILEDFLEDKISSLLNLPRTCEYFLRFARDSNAYHCLLLSKDSLKGYVSSAETFLSHPCLLCVQFLQEKLESQAFLVQDSYHQWTLVLYEKREITFLQPMKNLEIAREKIESLKAKSKNFSLTLWIADKSGITAEIQEIQVRFGARILDFAFDEIELLESLNFNPIEKSLPLSKQKVGIALKFSILGVFAGLGISFVLLILNFLASQEITNLQSQIEEQNTKINHQNQSHTQTQKQALFLQEKLESLQKIYDENANFLKNVIPNTSQLVPFLNIINPILEQQKAKIAYLGLEEGLYSLLLRGKNTLQVLEELERAHLAEIQSLEKYQDFYWIQMRISQ